MFMLTIVTCKYLDNPPGQQNGDRCSHAHGYHHSDQHPVCSHLISHDALNMLGTIKNVLKGILQPLNDKYLFLDIPMP